MKRFGCLLVLSSQAVMYRRPSRPGGRFEIRAGQPTHENSTNGWLVDDPGPIGPVIRALQSWLILSGIVPVETGVAVPPGTEVKPSR